MSVLNRQQQEHRRAEFERWARDHELGVGRDEFGYYDDDAIGALHFKAWCAGWDAAPKVLPPPQAWWRRVLGMTG